MAVDDDSAGRALLGKFFPSGQIQRLSATANGTARVTAINQLIDAYNNSLQQQIWSDGSTRRMLIGYQLNGWGTGKHWGIKISEEDYDVLTAADANLLFKLSY